MLAGRGRDTKYVFMQLSDEMRELIHDGAGPIPPRDRQHYYDRVAAELRKGPLTNAGAVEAVLQRELLRPPIEA